MAKIKSPLPLLKIIASGRFETIYVHKAGMWMYSSPNKSDLAAMLKREEIQERSKAESVFQLYRLNEQLLQNTESDISWKTEIEQKYVSKMFPNVTSFPFHSKEQAFESIFLPYIKSTSSETDETLVKKEAEEEYVEFMLSIMSEIFGVQFQWQRNANKK
ncbi:hypothetical protein [Mangrovibacillus cuniculi]|uniref:Uncharacterized protein n=1 Tax=Mangrovibacillus cuniculi TaxID=2593652 RepID=A0A7S8CDT8_9BACI|nr:hypothetical protein [Mangrovibacillus cuniculi]QPC48144.1 hypothetical protein G8O30_15000 [Mangrovibacillus cuniculi]